MGSSCIPNGVGEKRTKKFVFKYQDKSPPGRGMRKGEKGLL
jgi:hypothetical protein